MSFIEFDLNKIVPKIKDYQNKYEFIDATESEQFTAGLYQVLIDDRVYWTHIFGQMECNGIREVGVFVTWMDTVLRCTGSLSWTSEIMWDNCTPLFAYCLRLVHIACWHEIFPDNGR